MKIYVLAEFDAVDRVDARDLKRLIAGEQITAFKRASGWVTVEDGPIRGAGGYYDGPERREIRQRPLDEINGFHYCLLHR